MQRKLAGALLVALAFGTVACGSASKSLTAAQLRTRAGAVCRDVTRRIETLQVGASNATLHASLARAAVVLSDGLDKLHALTPPKQLAAHYAAFLAWEESRRDAARTLSHGARLSARERRAIQAHHSPVTPLSRQLGLSGCY